LSTQLFLIDDHPIIRESLQILIAARFEEAKVLCFASLDDFGLWFSDNGESIGPKDLALLDLGLPGYVGIESLLSFVQNWPQVKVIVFSGQANPSIVRAVAQAGAKGFIGKNIDMTVFLKAIDLILSGGEFFPADVLRQDLPQPHSNGHGGLNNGKSNAPILAASNGLLSQRQQRVLELLSNGASNKVIARDMNMSESTVKNTLAAIMRLLDTHNRTQTVQSARDRGLV
jgi:DNA-binding NarL/FixJ family response regulator